LLSQTGYGQSVDPTIYTSPVVIGPTSITARQTGNDVIGSGMGTFRVFVNDGDRFLYWANNTSTFYSGSVAYAAALVNDPDVALVTWNDTAYAVVVYHDVGTGFFCKVFKWSGTAFNVVYQNGLLTGSFTNDCAINVDGDNYGNYIITWDDGAGNIYYATGDAASNITYSTTLVSSSGYKWGDVALFNDGSSNVATFAYVDVPNDDIIVEQHTYSNLVAGTISAIYITSPALSAPTGEHFEMYPRVACPPPAGASSDWTVVAQSADKPTSSRILGWNSNSGTVSSYDYTAATSLTLNSWNSTGLNNYFPAVTYDYFYPSGSHPIWVGWSIAAYNAGTSFDNADYVVTIPCDPNGTPFSNIYELQKGQNSPGSSDYSEALSLAGCHNCDILMTYWINYALGITTPQQANYLEISNPVACTSSFRTSNVIGTEINDYQLNVQLVSITGVLIDESVIDKLEINNYLKRFSNLSGLYIFNTTDNSGISEKRKIIFKH